MYFFIIDKISCGKLRVYWCDIFRIYLKSQMLAALETRAGRQKIGGERVISDCQTKPVCLTEDGYFRARRAENKQCLLQWFWVQSTRRAKFSASDVALLVFDRLSESYYKRFFSRSFHRLLKLPKFGTLGGYRPGAYRSSRKKMILNNNGIFRLWRWNPTEFISN